LNAVKGRPEPVKMMTMAGYSWVAVSYEWWRERHADEQGALTAL
jgi:hypothetical protein